MVTVLVTGAGGASGIGAIQTLNQTTNYKVVGVDINADAAGLYFADDARQVPPAIDDDWTQEMSAVIEEFDIDVVIPTVDEELSLLPTLPEDVPSIVPRDKVIQVALDKYKTYNLIYDSGQTVPQTWLAADWPAIPSSTYPVLIKPRRGRGSRGIQRVDSPSKVEDTLEKVDYDFEELIIQEYIEGTEYTTSVVATSDDRLLSIVPKEAMEKNGSTVKGVTRRNKAVSDACQSIAETLSPAGPMNVQQIVDKDGQAHTIEINPRFSSTSCLTVAAGVNEFELLIRDALGDSVSSPESYKTGVYILRYDGHVFVDQDQLVRPEK